MLKGIHPVIRQIISITFVIWIDYVKDKFVILVNLNYDIFVAWKSSQRESIFSFLSRSEDTPFCVQNSIGVNWGRIKSNKTARQLPSLISDSGKGNSSAATIGIIRVNLKRKRLISPVSQKLWLGWLDSPQICH